MPNPLLRTKLHCPPLRTKLVPHPQLIKWLNQEVQLGHKLTMVSAPAGFGKSTLVSEWFVQNNAAAIKTESEETQQPSPFRQRSRQAFTLHPYKVTWLSLNDEGE